MVPGIIAPRVGKLSLSYDPIVYARALSISVMMPRPSISTPNCLLMGAMGVDYVLHNIYSTLKLFPRA